MATLTIITALGAAVLIYLGARTLIKIRKQKIDKYFDNTTVKQGIENAGHNNDTTELQKGIVTIQRNVDLNMEFADKYGKNVSSWPIAATIEYIKILSKGVQ